MVGGTDVRRTSIVAIVLGLLAALSVATVAIATDGDGTPADTAPATDLACASGEVAVQEILSYAHEALGYDTEHEAFDAYAADSSAEIASSMEVTMVLDDTAVAGSGESEVIVDLAPFALWYQGGAEG